MGEFLAFGIVGLSTAAIYAIIGSGLRSGFANSSHLPAYAQFNLGVSREFVTGEFGKLKARFDVVNLFDEKYEIRDGTGIGVGAPQFGPRRGFFAGIVKEF